MLVTALSSITAAVGGAAITSVFAKALSIGLIAEFIVFCSSYLAVSVLLGSFTDSEIALFKKKLNFRNNSSFFGYIKRELKKEEFK